MTPSALEAYLERLGLPEAVCASEDSLYRLHAAHPRTIPFENISPFLGQRVSLAPEDIVAKLVHARRGGYCFEHNLLFAAVLRQLGFQVDCLAARVRWQRSEADSLPRTHVMLRVSLGEHGWLADVGFGGQSLLSPLRWQPGLPQQTPMGCYRLSPCGTDELQLELLSHDEWRPVYRLSLQCQTAADLDMMNWYVSTHPASRFVSELVLARADHAERHTLLDLRYGRTDANGEILTRKALELSGLSGVLDECFHLRLDSDELAALKARLLQKQEVMQ